MWKWKHYSIWILELYGGYYEVHQLRVDKL